MRILLSYFFFLITVSAMAQSDSVLVADAQSGRVFISQNEMRKRPVASLTKIATALVVLDVVRVSGMDLGQQSTVPATASLLGGSNPMGLQPGDQISLRDALYSALLGSDNVAAHTLADHIGRALLVQRGKGGNPVKEFVKEMNALAKAAGMIKTRFANATGLDTAKQRGFSTAWDMATLSIRAMRDEGFAFYVRQKDRKVSFSRAGQVQSFQVKNTNKILGQHDIVGVKTGTTRLAGECLATYAQKKPDVTKLPDGRSRVVHRRLVCVVLGSPDRFGMTPRFLEQGFALASRWQADGFPTGIKGERYVPVPQE